MISRHRQLASITQESSWILNKWHPRDSHDQKNIPDINKPLTSENIVVVEEKSQWFSAILPCESSKVEQLLYIHFDNKPLGYWTADIIGDTEMTRLNPTVQTLLYVEQKIKIVPKVILIHLFREDFKEKLPELGYVGWVDGIKFDELILAEHPVSVGDVSNFIEQLHTKLTSDKA
jgi:hypothetical protein